MCAARSRSRRNIALDVTFIILKHGMLDDLFDSNGSACDEVATSSAKAVDLLSVFDSDDEQQDVHIPSCAEPRSDKLAQDDVTAIVPRVHVTVCKSTTGVKRKKFGSELERRFLAGHMREQKGIKAKTRMKSEVETGLISYAEAHDPRLRCGLSLRASRQNGAFGLCVRVLFGNKRGFKNTFTIVQLSELAFTKTVRRNDAELAFRCSPS